MCVHEEIVAAAARAQAKLSMLRSEEAADATASALWCVYHDEAALVRTSNSPNSDMNTERGANIQIG